MSSNELDHLLHHAAAADVHSRVDVGEPVTRESYPAAEALAPVRPIQRRPVAANDIGCWYRCSAMCYSR